MFCKGLKAMAIERGGTGGGLEDVSRGCPLCRSGSQSNNDRSRGASTGFRRECPQVSCASGAQWVCRVRRTRTD